MNIDKMIQNDSKNVIKQDIYIDNPNNPAHQIKAVVIGIYQ